MVKLREQYAANIAKDTGKDPKKVLEDIERDYWMNAEETVKYGLVDKIMQAKKK